MAIAVDRKVPLDVLMAQAEQLQEEIYKAHRSLTPMYPWVLVMVLNKEQTRKSGIVLAEKQQNKPMHEGIVLAVWQERWIESGTINKDGEKLTRTLRQTSDLKVGDHVLFHHWAGLPIHGFDDQKFRVVRERDWHETQQGGIVGKINYADPATDPLEISLREFVKLMYEGSTQDELPLLEAKLRARFMVIDKETESVTLSGA